MDPLGYRPCHRKGTLVHCFISSASFEEEEVEGEGLHPHLDRRLCLHHPHLHPAESSSCLLHLASSGLGISSPEHNPHLSLLLPLQGDQRPAASSS